jgi:hypothetical protein
VRPRNGDSHSHDSTVANQFEISDLSDIDQTLADFDLPHLEAAAADSFSGGLTSPVACIDVRAALSRGSCAPLAGLAAAMATNSHTRAFGASPRARPSSSFSGRVRDLDQVVTLDVAGFLRRLTSCTISAAVSDSVDRHELGASSMFKAEPCDL